MLFRIKKIVISIFLFCAIFAPPLFSFNIIYILLPFSLLYIIINNSARIQCNSNLLKANFVFAIYFLSIIVIGIIIGDEKLLKNRIIAIYQVIFLMVSQYICAYSVCSFAKKNKMKRKDALNLCIFAGMIEGALVMLSLLSPIMRRFFLDIMIKKAGKSVYARMLGTDAYYRAYGFADTLLDTFGYGMGLLAGMCLFNEKKNFKMYIIMIIFILSTAVNSRTGILVFLLALLINALYNLKWGRISIEKLCKGVTVVLICFSLFIYGVNNSSIMQSATIDWIKAGFESLFNFFIGRQMDYRLGSMQNSLFSSKFWLLPDNIVGLLFGEGHSIYGVRNILGIASDVGYINYVWICGIFGLLILLSCALKFFVHSYRFADTEYEKKVILLVAVSFFVVFAKGNIITHTAGTFISIFSCLITKIRDTEVKAGNYIVSPIRYIEN